MFEQWSAMYEIQSDCMNDGRYFCNEMIPCPMCNEELHERAEEWRQAHPLCPDSWVCSDDCANKWETVHWEDIEEVEA